MVGYVLTTFPQLSETFVEGELRVLRELGVDLRVASLHRPDVAVVGPTELPPDHLAYMPGPVACALAFLRWSALRPRATAANVAVAIRHRSLTMLRGAWLGAWAASHFRQHEVRHLHAHFATDAASVALAAAALLRVTSSFTIHARELYLRTGGLCARIDRADLVVTVCHYNVEQLALLCPDVPPGRVEIVRCGVDLDRFPLREDPGEREGLRLLTVGRLVEKKGFGDLVEAVALLRAEGLDAKCEIIGSGPLADSLDQQIRRLGLEDAVSLRGARLPDEVADAMATCDVFVLPCVVAASGDRDSMPVVIKEAMATGVPVVATDEVGIPEMVDDTVGRLVRPRDPRSLAAAITSVARLDPSGRRALGLAGRDRVARTLDLRSESARLKELFDRLHV